MKQKKNLVWICLQSKNTMRDHNSQNEKKGKVTSVVSLVLLGTFGSPLQQPKKEHRKKGRLESTCVVSLAADGRLVSLSS